MSEGFYFCFWYIPQSRWHNSKVDRFFQNWHLMKMVISVVESHCTYPQIRIENIIRNFLVWRYYFAKKRNESESIFRFSKYSYLGKKQSHLILFHSYGNSQGFIIGDNWCYQFNTQNSFLLLIALFSSTEMSMTPSETDWEDNFPHFFDRLRRDNRNSVYQINR